MQINVEFLSSNCLRKKNALRIAIAATVECWYDSAFAKFKRFQRVTSSRRWIIQITPKSDISFWKVDLFRIGNEMFREYSRCFFFPYIFSAQARINIIWWWNWQTNTLNATHIKTGYFLVNILPSVGRWNKGCSNISLTSLFLFFLLFAYPINWIECLQTYLHGCFFRPLSSKASLTNTIPPITSKRLLYIKCCSCGESINACVCKHTY